MFRSKLDKKDTLKHCVIQNLAYIFNTYWFAFWAKLSPYQVIFMYYLLDDLVEQPQ